MVKKLDILEFGGGDGALFDRISMCTAKYYNIEPGIIQHSEDSLDRINNKNYSCIRCSAENIPLNDATIDIVISIASLDHIPDYISAIKEAKRLLKKDGIFILCFNNKSSWWKILLKNTKYMKKREFIISSEHYFQWSSAQANDIFSYYFDFVEIDTLIYMPYVPYIWKFLFPISELIGPKFLKLFGWNICLICKITS